VLETGETTTVLHTHLDSAGNEQYIEITASPVKDPDGRTFGMVETYRNILEKKIDDELVNLVQKLNETQLHLKLMSITDELTGLRNRRFIMERLEEEFQRARRSGRPLSLMMLDIDHFKQVNDANGHLFGDIVLRVVSMRIKAHLRRHDLVGRVGGEEFLVVSPDSGLDDTIMVAERIRKVVNDEAICDAVREVSVALSAGVTTMRENDTSVDILFSRADTALYKAKEEGRNRVVALP
jgi:diguanylate cyclase (GGDEF)-like protein